SPRSSNRTGPFKASGSRARGRPSTTSNVRRDLAQSPQTGQPQSWKLFLDGPKARSHVRTRGATGPGPEAVQPEGLVQVALGESSLPRAAAFVLALQPSAEPIPHVVVHDPVGLLHRPQAKIARPPLRFPFDRGDLKIALARGPPPFR